MLDMTSANIMAGRAVSDLPSYLRYAVGVDLEGIEFPLELFPQCLILPKVYMESPDDFTQREVRAKFKDNALIISCFFII